MKPEKPFKRIYLEITNQCNLTCEFCLNTKRPLANLTPFGFDLLAAELKNWSDYLYLHVKGEPLSHPKLETILNSCLKHQLHVQLVTNGTLIKNWPKELWAHPALRKISISLHSIDQHHSPIQEYASDILSLIAQATGYVELRIWNHSLIYESVRLKALITLLSSALKIDFPATDFKINPKLFVAYDQKFAWPGLNLPPISTVGRCLSPKLMLTILVDGTVVPCCLDGEKEIPLGNIFQQPLAEILKNPRYQAMVAGFNAQQLVEPLCQRCNYRERFRIK